MNGVIGDAAHLVAAVWGVLGLALYLALALSGRRHRRAVRRRGAALMAIGAEKRRPGRAVSGALAAKEWIAPLGAVATGVVLVGGLLGCVAGLAGAYIARRWQRARRSGEQGAGASEMAEAARQLPLAADLLAACISAGAGPWEAAEAVGDSLGGPVGVCLARTAAEIRLGGEPAVAWGRFGEIPGSRRAVPLPGPGGIDRSSGGGAGGAAGRGDAGGAGERGRDARPAGRRADHRTGRALFSARVPGSRRGAGGDRAGDRPASLRLNEKR